MDTCYFHSFSFFFLIEWTFFAVWIPKWRGIGIGGILTVAFIVQVNSCASSQGLSSRQPGKAVPCESGSLSHGKFSWEFKEIQTPSENKRKTKALHHSFSLSRTPKIPKFEVFLKPQQSQRHSVWKPLCCRGEKEMKHREGRGWRKTNRFSTGPINHQLALEYPVHWQLLKTSAFLNQRWAKPRKG